MDIQQMLRSKLQKLRSKDSYLRTMSFWSALVSLLASTIVTILIVCAMLLVPATAKILWLAVAIGIGSLLWFTSFRALRSAKQDKRRQS